MKGRIENILDSGDKLRILQRYIESIKESQLDIQYNPTLSTSLNKLGVVFLELKRNEEAMEQFNSLLNITLKTQLLIIIWDLPIMD